ncbi:hypothetical protein [uncultured Sphingomonas sp.]|uniref:hypothetical protein n=1 Tax=uncultured Sphingomonas sp. TaxID=158754 RepID=UPI0035CA2244
MIFSARVALAAALFSPAASQAQTAPAAPATSAATATPVAGATIYDSAGAVVGTVDQVTPQAVVVNVDGSKVSLPPASIGSGPQGLRISITRAEVVAAAKQAQAGAQQQLQAQLMPGATVRGSAGAVVGTVKSADAQFVTLTTTKGDVQLPMSGFGMGANGPVIGMTAAQLDAAVMEARGSAASSEATSTEATGAAAAGAAATGVAKTTTTAKKTTTTRTRRKPR